MTYGKDISWVCFGCGTERYGAWEPGHVATWHMANCDVCGKYTAVTEPRDFGTPPTIDFAEPHTWAASPDEPYCAEPRNLEDETPVVKVTPQPCVCERTAQLPDSLIDAAPAHIPLSQQLAWFDIYAARAADLLIERIVANRSRLIAAARRRGIDGFRTYVDSLCHKPDVLPDLDEELADGIWYGTEHLRRQHEAHDAPGVPILHRAGTCRHEHRGG